jgi:WD40 repeat protein
MLKSAENSAALLTRPVTENVWRIFVSYRRSELTTNIGRWLKEELERETLVSSTGQVFSLDVFVDAAEPHRPDFQANLVPRLRHSRALLVLADEGAALRRKAPLADYLYQELDWWAKERRSAPPIILQLDKSALKLVDDPALVKWRKVNFLLCPWEDWRAHADNGQAEKARLLSQVRESIRTFGEIVHLEEVRRLRRRAYLAAAFAIAALIGTCISFQQSRESKRQRDRAEAQTSIARSESNAAALAAAHFASSNGDFLTARNWLDGINPTQRAWEWFYLRGLTDTSIATFRQTDRYLGSHVGWEGNNPNTFQEQKLTVVAFSPDGSLIAAGSEYGKLLVWNSQSGGRLYDRSISNEISSIAFDPDGSSIAVGSLDGSVSLFNMRTNRVEKLSQEKGAVSVVLYTATGKLVSAAWDGSITIWDTALRSQIGRHESTEARIKLKEIAEKEAAVIKKYGAIQFPNLRRVIKLDENHYLNDGETNLEPIEDSFLSAVPAADGHSLWAAMGDRTIVRVDLRTWQIKKLTVPVALSKPILVPGFRPVVVDREQVKSGANYFEGRINSIWEPGDPQHKVNGRMLGTSAHVLGLSPDGKRLAISSGNRVDIYRFDDLSLEQRLVGHDLPVTKATFLPDGSRLATSSEDGHVKIWDLHRPERRPSIRAHSGGITAIVFRLLGDEQSILTASDDGTIKSYPLSLISSSVLFRQKHAIRSISLSNDGQRLALLAEGGNVASVDLVGVARRPHPLNITTASAVSFNRNGEHLLVAMDARKDGVSFRLFDAVTGKVLATGRDDDWAQSLDVNALAPAPFRDEFAWVSDSKMGVGNAGFRTISTLEKLPGSRSGDYDSVAMSADESLAAFGSRTGEIEVTGTPGVPRSSIESLRGHLGAVNGLAFTSRGTRLISGSEDGSIRIWDLDHNRELLLIRTGSAVRSVAISPDGRTLAAGLADGTLCLWDAPGAPPN